MAAAKDSTFFASSILMAGIRMRTASDTNSRYRNMQLSYGSLIPCIFALHVGVCAGYFVPL